MKHADEPATLADPKAICPTLTRRKLSEEGALLVDVRERDEVAALAFDVPAVVNIPLSEFERRFAELPRDRELIVACAVGQRSLKAAYYLIYQGYPRVANMEDGMAKWLRKGFPVHGDASAVLATGSGCCASTTTAAGGGCCGSAAVPASSSGSCAGAGT